jgi:GMP synthase (glutamine-hydrolysing)
MNVLIIKNIANEGPGTIEEFLREQGMEYTILDFSDCSATGEIPDTRKYSHLVIMGGPMAVYESDGLPYLHLETALVRVFIKNRKPVLGICLGAQIIAHSLKADVYEGRVKEVGWQDVEITAEGMEDPVFSALSVDGGPRADVFQWHGDTFDLPAKAVRLSTSSAYPNQAFRYGDAVYALQFHIEINPYMIEEWFGKEDAFDSKKMINEAHRIFPEYRQRAFRFYGNFFR